MLFTMAKGPLQMVLLKQAAAPKKWRTPDTTGWRNGPGWNVTSSLWLCMVSNLDSLPWVRTDTEGRLVRTQTWVVAGNGWDQSSSLHHVTTVLHDCTINATEPISSPEGSTHCHTPTNLENKKMTGSADVARPVGSISEMGTQVDFWISFKDLLLSSSSEAAQSRGN